MSSTNKTTYYDLPQFVDSDLFNPLVDDNDAYSKIDTALHQIAEAEAGDASEIVGVKSRVTTAEGKIETLETQNGSEALATTAQTLSGAVNELDADVASLDGRVDIVEDDINNANTGLKAKVDSLGTRMTTAEGDIDALEAQNGSETLATTAQTLSGAVNELNKLAIFVTPEMFGAKGDGVTDDTTALKNCITYALANKAEIKGVTGSKYHCSEALTIDNHANFYPLKIDFNNAQIVFSDDVVNCITFALGADNNDKHCVVKNMHVICGNSSSVGIYVGGSKQIEFDNCNVFNVHNIGVYMSGTSYEINFENCIVYSVNEANTIGFNIEETATDNNFISCRSINAQIGFKIKGPANVFNGCHPWITVGNGLAGSIGFDDLTINNTFIACYADNFETGWRVLEPYIIISGCFYNQFYKNTDDETAPAFLSMPNFYVRAFKKAIICNNIIRFNSANGFTPKGIFLREDENGALFFGNIANNTMYEMANNPNRVKVDISSFLTITGTLQKQNTYVEGDICHLQFMLSYHSVGGFPTGDVNIGTLPDWLQPQSVISSVAYGRQTEYGSVICPIHLYIGTNGGMAINADGNPTQYNIYVDVWYNLKAQ